MNPTNSNGEPDPPGHTQRGLNPRSRAIARPLRRTNPTVPRIRQAELMAALDQERNKNRDLASENEDLKMQQNELLSQLQEQISNVAQLEERLMQEGSQSDGVVIPNCTICYESWDSSGPHRMISLRCGHLFGDSCIREYLRRGRSNCPVCRQTAIANDIRYMYIDA